MDNEKEIKIEPMTSFKFSGTTQPAVFSLDEDYIRSIIRDEIKKMTQADRDWETAVPGS